MLAADPEWMDLAAAAGHEVRAIPSLTLRDLRGAELLLVRGEGAWERLRAWRAAGVAVGVVVVTDGEDSPDDRPRLEPVVLLRRTDADGFAEARERLAVGEAPGRVALAGGVADFHRGVFERADGQLVRLTGLEVRLLAYLAARSFRVVGRDELQEQVWGYRRPLETKTVEMTVARLRKKIEAASVLTVRGEGYRAVRLAAAADPGDAALGALRRAALLLSQHGRPQEALQLLDQHEHGRTDLRGVVEARVLRLRVLTELGRLPAAETVARDAMAIAEDEGWATVVGDAALGLAHLLRITARPAEARSLVERAHALFEASGAEVGVARALSMASDLAPPEEGLALAARALEIFERIPHDERHQFATLALQAALRMRVANGARRLGRHAEAGAHYEAAARLYEALGNRVMEMQALAAVGATLAEQFDDAGARAAFDRALEAGRRSAGGRLVAEIEAVVAAHALVTGDLARCRELLSAAIDRIGGALDRPEHVHVAVVIVAERVALGDLAGARAALATLPPLDGPLAPLLWIVGWLRVAAAATEAEASALAAAVPPPASHADIRFVGWARDRCPPAAREAGPRAR